jgi:putative hydrolase
MPLFQGGRSTSISFGESGTASVIAQAARGEEPGYPARLIVEAEPAPRTRMRAALRGDCHTHSDWSDGGSPPREMAEAARDLGHEWIALTDHSPRLSSRTDSR